MGSDERDIKWGSTGVELMTGMFYAGVNKTINAPLARVSILLQSQNELIKNGRLNGNFGIIGCFKSLTREEGIAAFWRGNLASVARVIPSTILTFGLKDKFKDILGYTKEKDGYWKWFCQNLIAGAAAGGTSLLVLYPFDYVRVQMGADVLKNGTTLFPSYKHLLRETFEKTGVFGFYRGIALTFGGVMIYRGLYFGLYDSLKPLLLSGDLSDNVLASFLFGWGVTTIAATVNHPIDVIRKRRIVNSLQPVVYKNSFYAVKEILSKEGWRPLFHGYLFKILWR